MAIKVIALFFMPQQRGCAEVALQHIEVFVQQIVSAIIRHQPAALSALALFLMEHYANLG